MTLAEMTVGKIYTLSIKRAGGTVTSYTGRFLKHTFTRDHDEAVLLGIVGEARTARIASSLVTAIDETPDEYAEVSS